MGREWTSFFGLLPLGGTAFSNLERFIYLRQLYILFLSFFVLLQQPTPICI